MKVLDRYLLRELLLPIFYCAFSLIFLILIADLFDNLEDLLRHQTPPGVILRYYVSLVPYSFTQIIPWAAWLGTLFLLVNLGFHNETIAMKAAGLKITTIIRPVLFVGFLLGILTFLVSDRLVPSSIRTAQELRSVYIEQKQEAAAAKALQNVTYATGNQIYFFRNFFEEQKELQGVVVLWQDTGRGEGRKKMLAQTGRWDEGVWRFQGVTEYAMDSRGRVLGEPKTFAQKTYPEISFSPEELSRASTERHYLSYKELKGSVNKLRENGVGVQTEMVELHYRLASPWQSLVMMLLVIPLLAKTTTRKLIALNVLFCVGLVFGYHLTCALGVALGEAGKLLPFMSAWSGNILFAAGALFFLDRGNY